jgi:hypothetical protein
MPELEQQLRSLATVVEWPPTPELVPPPQLLPVPRRHVPRRALVVALAAAVAIGVAFAVPPARSALLRFLGFGGVRIERVATLPRAAELPLAESLGTPVSAAAARRVLGEPMRLPPTARRARLYASGPAVSALLRAGGRPLLLSELRADPNGFFLKKLAAGSTRVEWLSLQRPDDAIWIAGGPHIVVGPTAPPRLAGNVLLWQHGGLTYRLEGRRLTRDRAVALARAILGG